MQLVIRFSVEINFFFSQSRRRERGALRPPAHSRFQSQRRPSILRRALQALPAGRRRREYILLLRLLITARHYN